LVSTLNSATESMLVVAMLPPLSPVSMLATPSIVMLFAFGRWPLTVNELTCPISRPAPSPCIATPGTRVAKLNSMRPLFAMLVSACVSSANDRSPLVVCSSLTREVTLTLSVRAPTSSTSVPADSLSFALTTRLVCSRVLNPSSVAFSTYESGRTIAKTKRPSASVTTVATSPCDLLVSVTVTPGITPCDESTTVPVTDALVVWACAGALPSATTAAATATSIHARANCRMRAMRTPS
jgi:hypothetical protein